MILCNTSLFSPKIETPARTMGGPKGRRRLEQGFLGAEHFLTPEGKLKVGPLFNPGALQNIPTSIVGRVDNHAQMLSGFAEHFSRSASLWPKYGNHNAYTIGGMPLSQLRASDLDPSTVSPLIQSIYSFLRLCAILSRSKRRSAWGSWA